MHRRSLHSLIGALLLLPLTLQAAGWPRAGISDIAAPQLTAPEKLQFLNRLSSELQRISRMPLVRDSDSSDRLAVLSEAQRKEKDSLQRAAKALQEGRQAYLNLDLAAARQRLEEARKQFILNLHRLDDNSLLLQSHLYLGMTYVALEQQKLGVEEFRKVAFLDPELELATKDYSPEVVATFSMAKSAIDREAQGLLLLESTPSRAKLLINAKSFGETPVNLSLPIGEYFFRLTKPGHRDWYQLVKINEGFQKIQRDLNESVSQEEEQATAFLPVTKELPPTSKGIEWLSKKSIALQTDILLLGEIRRGKELEFSGQWFDARTQEFTTPIRVKASGDFNALLAQVPAAARALLKVIDENGYIVADKTLTPRITATAPPASINPMLLSQPGATAGTNDTGLQPQLKPAQPWYKKWWVWGLVGGAAAGIATAVIIAGQEGSSGIIVDNTGNLPGQ